MGGAVSSGESNDDLIDNLLEADYIKSPLVERVFRAVDRAFYYTEPYKQNAYKDLAWKDGNLHLSAPCIYSEVLENLDLRPGMCFLNIGSGTGYFSTMCGLILGKTGVNHGVELYPDVVNYARMKLEEFGRTSPAIDEFDFCHPEFTVGNCLDAIPASKRYDRIYCGAACPNDYVGNLIDMLKIGGICVVPLGDSLVQITRTEEQKDERKVLLPVSFATLISPNKENAARAPVELPEWSPKLLTELCRSEIRSTLRQTINYPEPKGLGEESRKKKRRRRQERRRAASRLVVVQRRRSVGEVDGGDNNGFVAIAYSMESNSSDEDRNQQNRRADADSSNQDQNDSSTTSSEDSQDGESRSKAKLDDSDTIMEEEEEEPKLSSESSEVEVSPTPTNNEKEQGGCASTSAGSSRDRESKRVAVVTGACSILSKNGKSTGKENGTRDSGETNNGTEQKTTSSSPSSVGLTWGRGGGGATVANGNGGGGRSASARVGRGCTTGAESLLGRVRELLVRARQHELESVRRQFRRSVSDADSGRSRSASGRGNNEGMNDLSNPPRRENGRSVVEALFSDLTSSDSSSPSASATSTSDDEVTNDSAVDGCKKRCRNESGENLKGSEEPKPDPLIVNPCSVQMRRKILELPLPPALKVYLNHDRKLHY